MTTTISSSRRNEIKQIVFSALQRFPNATLPTQIKAICKSYSNIRLIPYSVHMKRNHLSYSEMMEYCGTSDSCADYYADFNKYIIYYNDLDTHNIVNSNRYRWNIAHELGHVLLDHHKLYDKTRIFRCSLTDAEYNHLEEEADYFAQLILVPHVVLYAFRITTASQLKLLCKISSVAANRRFRAFQVWSEHVDGDDLYDKPLFYYYFDYIFKKECRTCGAHVVQRYGKHCPICGNKTLQWGDGKMKYYKLEAHENGKLKICPTCKNEETEIDGYYCQICGSTLGNYCSNYNCKNDNELPTNARYCPICGSNSTFYNAGFLKEWNYKEPDGFLVIPELDEELPFN